MKHERKNLKYNYPSKSMAIWILCKTFSLPKPETKVARTSNGPGLACKPVKATLKGHNTEPLSKLLSVMNVLILASEVDLSSNSASDMVSINSRSEISL